MRFDKAGVAELQVGLESVGLFLGLAFRLESSNEYRRKKQAHNTEGKRNEIVRITRQDGRDAHRGGAHGRRRESAVTKENKTQQRPEKRLLKCRQLQADIPMSGRHGVSPHDAKYPTYKHASKGMSKTHASQLYQTHVKQIQETLGTAKQASPEEKPRTHELKARS
jgi:hypothetical protein